MTGEEMLIAVQIGLRKLNSKGTKSYFPEEIEIQLNKAQDRFVASKVRKRDNKQYEYDIADEECLSPLKVDTFITTTTAIKADKYKFPLDKELAYYIRGNVRKENCDADINLIKSSMINKVQSTPYYKSSMLNYNAELLDKGIKIYPHKNTISIEGIDIVYIRKPKKIQVNSSISSELDELYHQSIVDLAVAIMKVDNSQQDSRLKDEDNKVNSILLG